MKRVLRWALIALAVVAMLLVAAVIAVQVVLSGDRPRRMVEAQLERQTGLRVELAALDTGWGGTTVLRDVSFALPLAEEPLLVTPRIEATHATLLSILLWRDVGLVAAAVHEPAVTVRREASGRWNLREAIDLIRQRQRRGGDAKPGGPTKLPEVTLRDGTLRVVDAAGAAAEFAGLRFQGVPADADQQCGRVTSPRAGGHGTVFAPEGRRDVATGGAHRNPWRSGALQFSSFFSSAPAGAEGARLFVWFLRPCRGGRENNKQQMWESGFHGFRCAPPVATPLRPSGAKSGHPGVSQCLIEFTPLHGTPWCPLCTPPEPGAL